MIDENFFVIVFNFNDDQRDDDDDIEIEGETIDHNSLITSSSMSNNSHRVCKMSASSRDKGKNT